MSSSAITAPLYLDPTKAADGSAAAPSFAFSNSTSTGVYRVSADTLGISTAGVQRVVVDASGNVGVGTASPAQKVHIQGNIQLAAASFPSIKYADVAGDIKAEIYYGVSGLDLNLLNTKAGPLVFSTNSTERMRIDASGRLSVGNSSSSNTIGGLVNIENTTNSQNGFTYYYNTSTPTASAFYVNSPQAGTATTSWNAFYLRAAGTDRFFVVGNGQIYSQFTSILSASDISLKENIRDLDTGLAQILALKPRRFDWKEDADVGLKNVSGFIAQEVEEILPELVQEFKYRDDEHKKAIKTGDMIPVLVKAIQELSAKNEEQSSRIDALEARLAALEAK